MSILYLLTMPSDYLKSTEYHDTLSNLDFFIERIRRDLEALLNTRTLYWQLSEIDLENKLKINSDLVRSHSEIESLDFSYACKGIHYYGVPDFSFIYEDEHSLSMLCKHFENVIQLFEPRIIQPKVSLRNLSDSLYETLSLKIKGKVNFNAQEFTIHFNSHMNVLQHYTLIQNLEE